MKLLCVGFFSAALVCLNSCAPKITEEEAAAQFGSFRDDVHVLNLMSVDYQKLSRSEEARALWAEKAQRNFASDRVLGAWVMHRTESWNPDTCTTEEKWSRETLFDDGMRKPYGIIGQKSVRSDGGNWDRVRGRAKAAEDSERPIYAFTKYGGDGRLVLFFLGD